MASTKVKPSNIYIKHLEHKIKIILNSTALIAKKIFEVFQDGLTINLQYLENHCWLEQDTHNVKVHLKKEFSILPLYWLFHCFCNRFQDPTSQSSLWNLSLFGELNQCFPSSFHSVHGIHIVMEIKKNEYWRWIALLGWLAGQIGTILGLHSIQHCCRNFS